MNWVLLIKIRPLQGISFSNHCNPEFSGEDFFININVINIENNFSFSPFPFHPDRAMQIVQPEGVQKGR